MKKIFILMILAALSLPLFSQITITKDDMPDVGDTIRYNTTYSTGGVDYTLAGPGYTWDFSSLNTILPQGADTFVHVWTTPLLYQLVFFYPLVSTIAQPQADFTLIPGLPLTDVYKYYKESNADFREVGQGITVNSIPLPFLYDDADIMYKFPVHYGGVDSSESGFAVNLAGIGYYGSHKKRVNYTDGWGTLITPFGSFPVLRVKTIIEQTDSLYIDTLGFGFSIPRNSVEYKWLGNGFGRPLLKVTETGILTVVEYLGFTEEDLTVNAGPDRTICQGESTQLVAVPGGGTEPYFFIWSSLQFGDTITVSPDETTDYVVTCIDSKLNIARDTVRVNVNLPPVADAGSDVTIPVTAVTQLGGSAAGGTPPYTWYWSPPTGLSDPTVPDPLAGPLSSTTYTLTVTDAFGCSGQDDVTVTVTPVPTFTISGRITESSTGDGMPGVDVDFSGLFPVVTNADGYYAKLVYQGYSGRSKPYKEYYEFEPDSIIYNNVQSDLVEQNYAGTYIPPVFYKISGLITDQGTGSPAEGVVVQFTGLPPVTTDNLGYYEKDLGEGWSGTVTPAGFNFSPPERTYTDLQGDFPNQDYVRLEGGLPPGWGFTVTGVKHNLYIPVTTVPKVYGQAIQAGDYLGVFFIDENGFEHCGGAVQYTGSGGVTLVAYGDDAGTALKDGFALLEPFIWKIYTWSDFSEYYAEAQYFFLFQNDGKFHADGYSLVTSLLVNGYTFDIRVYLEGPFADLDMNTHLNSNGYLPLAQPYNAAPWNYSGTESVTAIPNTRVVDWVLLEIRQTTGGPATATSGTVIARKACFLLGDGTLAGTNGTSLPAFTITPTANLYAVIIHRNHLAVMSANPLALQYGSYRYDWSDARTKAFGAANGHKQVRDGLWAMFGGDGNANRQVNNADKNDVWLLQSGSSGYWMGDFNLDGQVNNADKNDIWHPNSGRGSQVPN